MSGREFRRKVRSGPVGRWWIQDDLHYANVPGGVLVKIFDIRWGEEGDGGPGVTSSLCIIPNAVLMVKHTEKTLPPDEDEGYEAEEVIEVDARIFSDGVSAAKAKDDGWKVFR